MKVTGGALFLVLLTVGGPSVADTDVGPTSSGYYVHAVEPEPASSTDPPTSPVANDPVVNQFTNTVCAMGGAETCAEPAYCANGEPISTTFLTTAAGNMIVAESSCPEHADRPHSPPVITPGLVAAAFRRISLPASELVIEPPNGRTLVNLETNFFTEQGEFTRSVRLLGRSVELAIWPERFVWRFGDGAVLESESAGSAYPDLEITHAYRARGRVSPSVDTTYAARFRVDGGAWREVPGTVTVPGAAESLRVVTARPLLVGG